MRLTKEFAWPLAVLGLGLAALAGCPGEPVPGVLLGQRALDFSLPDAADVVHTLSEYGGKVVWIQFLVVVEERDACQVQASESMAAFYDRFAGQDFAILAVLVGKEAGDLVPTAVDAQAWADRYDLAYPVLYDNGSGGTWDTYHGPYAVAYPVNLVVDREGVIRFRSSGYIRPGSERYDTMAAIIAHWLAE